MDFFKWEIADTCNLFCYLIYMKMPHVLIKTSRPADRKHLELWNNKDEHYYYLQSNDKTGQKFLKCSQIYTECRLPVYR
jgi:hypothetical protein